MVTKTYLPSNLCDSSDSGDNSDSCDSSDSNDSIDSSDQKTFFPPCLFFKILFFTFFFVYFFFIKKYITNYLKTQIVMKLKNSNCDETQKLKWSNSKT